LLWNGSAESYIDLHQFLPTEFSTSNARNIDDYENIVGQATDISGNIHAILWEPVHEASTLFTLGLGAVMLRKKRS
jgi:hypothetical protein